VKNKQKKLKQIAKSLGIVYNDIEVCKVINGVKRCGLKRSSKPGKNTFVEKKITICTYNLYKKKPSTIENISNKKGFTKFTRYGASWEKKKLLLLIIKQEILF